MKILAGFRHRKAVEPFVDAIEALVDRGHEVTVAVHERDDKVPGLFANPGRLGFVSLPDGRRDMWADTAELARHLRDVAQYMSEPYRQASKLRRRVFDRLLKLLAVPSEVGARWSADALVDAGPEAVARLELALANIELAVPPDALALEAVRRLAPDVVLATPLIHFGSTQVELVKAARALGIPVGMLLFSWDNLGTKGALHVRPDHLFVWNERQREEARALHAFDAARITITGAPRFDRFFRLSSRVPHAAFCDAFGVTPDTPVVLYLCSSRLVTEKEVRFLRLWSRAVRHAPSEKLRGALLIVRPHPDVAFAEGKWIAEERRSFRWEGCPEVELTARSLFGDPRAVLLTTDNSSPQVLYESIFHSGAVVGLNTSAEIEAGIVGRPVFTVLADQEHADGQHTTLHFHYLTAAAGGWVQVGASLDEHIAQLGRELDDPTPADTWQGRVAAFVRPAGWTTPASDVLASAVETGFARRPEQRGGSVSVPPPAVSVPDAGSASVAPGLRKLQAENARAVERIEASGIDLWVVSADGSAGKGEGALRGLDWLAGRMAPGSVLYDLAAGDGLFAVAAARRIGCTVVAFEATVPALSRLWEHVLLNACDGLVIPVPIRPDQRAVVRQERYDRLAPNPTRLPLRMTRWREHDPAPGTEVIQPVLSMPLEWVVERWKLPVPQGIRAAVSGRETDVVGAIEGLLAERAVDSIVLHGADDVLAQAVARLERFGFAQVNAGDTAGGLALLARDRASLVTGAEPATGRRVLGYNIWRSK